MLFIGSNTISIFNFYQLVTSKHIQIQKLFAIIAKSDVASEAYSAQSIDKNRICFVPLLGEMRFGVYCEINSLSSPKMKSENWQKTFSSSLYCLTETASYTLSVMTFPIG